MVFENVSMNSQPSVIPSSFCFSTFLLCKLNVDRIPGRRLSDRNFSGCKRSMFVNNVSNCQIKLGTCAIPLFHGILSEKYIYGIILLIQDHLHG